MNAITVHVVAYARVIHPYNGLNWIDVHGVTKVVLCCDIEVVPPNFVIPRPNYGDAVIITEHMLYAVVERPEEIANLLDARILARSETERAFDTSILPHPEKR